MANGVPLLMGMVMITTIVVMLHVLAHLLSRFKLQKPLTKTEPRTSSILGHRAASATDRRISKSQGDHSGISPGVYGTSWLPEMQLCKRSRASSSRPSRFAAELISAAKQEGYKEGE